MGRYARSRTPDGPLVRATVAASTQISSYALVAAGSVLVVAVTSEATLAEWVRLGFVTPAIMAAFLIVVFGPRRRIVAEPVERPVDVQVASADEIRRLARSHLAVLTIIAVGLLLVGGAKGVLVMLAIGAAHVVALAVLRGRLRRCERRLDAPVYQRLRAGIWREPLWVYRDPGHGDPQVAAALGRRAGA